MNQIAGNRGIELSDRDEKGMRSDKGGEGVFNASDLTDSARNK